MKKKIIKGIVIYSILFLLFFIFRIIYGYVQYPATGQQQNNFVLPTNNRANLQSVFNNYASSKLKVKKISGKETRFVTVDQKYEKVATIGTYTKNFDKDEKSCRRIIVKYNALIQQESKTGLNRRRYLYMTIGVDPSKFDSMVSEIEKIGKIIHKSITKTDKTNEYKDLNAKKKSLFKIRDSLIALKNRGGKIDEFIKLENRILDIENQIQSLGVRLGEFDAENEFCTIKFSLSELSAVTSIPVIQRIKVALEWSVKIYIKLTLMMFFAVLTLFIFVVILEKLGWIPKIIKKYL